MISDPYFHPRKWNQRPEVKQLGCNPGRSSLSRIKTVKQTGTQKPDGIPLLKQKRQAEERVVFCSLRHPVCSFAGKSSVSFSASAVYPPYSDTPRVIKVVGHYQQLLLSMRMRPWHVQAGWQVSFADCTKLHAATVPAVLECAFSKLKATDLAAKHIYLPMVTGAGVTEV